MNSEIIVIRSSCSFGYPPLAKERTWSSGNAKWWDSQTLFPEVMFAFSCTSSNLGNEVQAETTFRHYWPPLIDDALHLCSLQQNHFIINAPTALPWSQNQPTFRWTLPERGVLSAWWPISRQQTPHKLSETSSFSHFSPSWFEISHQMTCRSNSSVTLTWHQLAAHMLWCCFAGRVRLYG